MLRDRLGMRCSTSEISPLCLQFSLYQQDRELQRRGHRFVRYADDCNIYVRSQRAGERVMESITNFISKKLKLKVNSEKSAVARPRERQFLGFSYVGTRNSAAVSAESDSAF